MILIAHRGNINGKLPERENEPTYIDEALDAGYSAEIDLRVNQNEKSVELWLGHDGPQYQISLDWLQVRRNQLWIHCKNREALEFCLKERLHCFWHDTDDYTMTSYGYVWAYPGKQNVGQICILVMPELHHWPMNIIKQQKPFGVCSDFVEQLKA